MEIFEISIFIVLHFFLVCTSFNHIRLILKIKRKEFFGCPSSLPLYKRELFLKDFFLNPAFN